MRIIFKTFFILSLLSVLSILFVPPVKAGCSFNSYYQCTGTCYCRCGGRCYCGVNQWGRCVPLGCNTNCCQYNCRKYSCNSNEDPVSGSCAGTDMVCCKPRPQPTRPGALPTGNPPTPTTAGLECPPSNLEGCRDATEWCMSKKCHCKCTSSGLTNCDPGCSSHCTNNRCYVTHVTPGQDKGCNNWGPWRGCMSGQDACGGCASQSYTCQVRYCNDSSSNAYQISCGCSQPPGGGGGGGSNTPYLSLQLLDPNLNIITPPVRLYCPPTPIFSPTPKPTFPPYCYLGSPIPGMPGATNPPNTSPCPLNSSTKLLTLSKDAITSIHPFAKSAATQLLVPLLPVNKMSPMPTLKESRPTRVGVFLTPLTFLPSLASPPSKTKISKKATTCPTAKTTINSKTATPGVRRFPQATAL